MKTINATKLKQLLDNKEAILIDVRESAEHRGGHIENSHLIPLDDISIDKLPSKSKPIIIHCHSGKRSMMACEKLLAQDPSLEVYSLDGGIVAWQKENFDIKKLETAILPLDQQTQLAVGILTLSGVLMGYFVHNIFYIIPGFTGLGLIFAGITGWCGMAKLLAKMSWNR